MMSFPPSYTELPVQYGCTDARMCFAYLPAWMDASGWMYVLCIYENI